MNPSIIPPSAFCTKPWGSVLQNSECEQIALNIMIIRKRLGDKWAITWDDYVEQCSKDRVIGYSEQGVFEKVYPLIADPIGAIGFSRDWADAARSWVTAQTETPT